MAGRPVLHRQVCLAFMEWHQRLPLFFLRTPKKSARGIMYKFLFFCIAMNLRIIATGGTFDKHYDPISGQLVVEESFVPIALARARITAQLSFVPLLALDSLDMDDNNRQQILSACIGASEDRIVIVHGTDTAQQTAAVLGNAALKKTIVLTGAMVPYEIANSDAFFNLGFALAAARLLPSGVYIAMNAEIFPWDEVRKNRAAGLFERTK